MTRNSYPLKKKTIEQIKEEILRSELIMVQVKKRDRIYNFLSNNWGTIAFIVGTLFVALDLFSLYLYVKR